MRLICVLSKIMTSTILRVLKHPLPPSYMPMLQQWSVLSGLNFNVAKTFPLSFCSHSHHLRVDYTLNNLIIPKATAA